MTRLLPRLGVVLALVLVALLPRLPLLLAPAGDLYRPVPDGSPKAAVSGEELHRGTTALHWLKRPILSVPDYQYASFHGGPLVTSVLAVPLFAALGPNLVALKATSLLFHLATVLLAFACLERMAGRRAAWFGALLLAGTPPGYSILSLTAYGTHVEGNALALAALYAYLRAHEREQPNAARFFLLGFVAGFGLFFVYTVALTLGALLAHRLWVHGRPRRGEPLPLLAGLALGFAPWLWLNVRSGLAGLHIYGGWGGPDSGPGAPETFFARMAGLFADGLPGASFFPDLAHVPGRALDIAYALLLAGGLLGLFLSRPGPQRRVFDVRFLALVPLLFSIGFAATHFDVGRPPDKVVSFRYVHVLYPSLLLALALVAARCAQRGIYARRAALGLVLATAVLCTAASWTFVRFARFGEGFDQPGYSHVAFGRFVALRQAEEPELLVRTLLRARAALSHKELGEFHRGVLRTLQELGDPQTVQKREPYVRRSLAARDTLASLIRDERLRRDPGDAP